MGKKTLFIFIHMLWVLTNMLDNKTLQKCLIIKVITKHCKDGS